MSSAPEYNPRYTVDDYQCWEGDWELWNGVAVAMTPSPFGKHGSVLARIAAAFTNAIDEVDCGASVLLEIDWIVSRDTVVRPDLSIVCGEPPAGHIESAPALVAEILSASTRERDLTFKPQLFQQHLVARYMIIDPEESSLKTFRLDKTGVYQEVPSADHVQIDFCENGRLNVRLDRVFR